MKTLWLLWFVIAGAALALLFWHLANSRATQIDAHVFVVKHCDLLIATDHGEICFDKTDGQGHKVPLTAADQSVIEQRFCNPVAPAPAHAVGDKSIAKLATATPSQFTKFRPPPAN